MVEETKTSEEQEGSAPSQEIKPKRSEAETTAFNLKKQAEKAKELGLDPAEILGVRTHIEVDASEDDDKPVTVGMLRNIQKQEAQKTALQFADDIADESTRDTVKQYLANNIVPSGDAEADFRLALAAASANKNKEVLQEINRYGTPKKTSAGGSMPATVEEEFVPTAQEQVFMRPPYNLSKEKILEARKKAAAAQ